MIQPAHTPGEKAAATRDAQRRIELAIAYERATGKAYEHAYLMFEQDRSEHNERRFHETREHYAAASQRLAAARVYVATTRAANKEPNSQQRQEARRAAEAALRDLEPAAVFERHTRAAVERLAS